MTIDMSQKVGAANWKPYPNPNPKSNPDKNPNPNGSPNRF